MVKDISDFPRYHLKWIFVIVFVIHFGFYFGFSILETICDLFRMVSRDFYCMLIA